MNKDIRISLQQLSQAMQQNRLWEASPPSKEALASIEPFAIDTLSPTQWLQWIFIPKMTALLDANGILPSNFAITPYLEEALKDEPYLPALCQPLQEIEMRLKHS